MLPRYFYDEGGMWVRASTSSRNSTPRDAWQCRRRSAKPRRRPAACGSALDLVKELNTGTHGSAGGVQRSHGAGRRGCVLAPGRGHARRVRRPARASFGCADPGQENAGDVEAATGNDLSRCCYPPGVPSSCCRRRGPSATRARGCCTAGTRAASRPARSPTRRPCCAAPALRALTLGHGAPADPDLRASFEDLAACASHGFPQLESEFRDAREAGIGDAIPSAAADFGADLIVMGHTDTAARANGSWEAPRARVGAMTLPVFSH